MAIRVARQLAAGFEAIRFEPVEKRVRVMLGGQAAADTTGARLVWEPSRIVPQYAIPVDDVLAALVPAGPGRRRPQRPRQGSRRGPSGRLMLTPGTGFGVHTADGEVLTVRLRDATRRGAAFRPDDPDLHGYVLLDFSAFDTWMEEDEEILSHPRRPPSTASTSGTARATSASSSTATCSPRPNRPTLVFETGLPVRYYLPADDVAATLRVSATTTACAYKGSRDLPGRRAPRPRRARSGVDLRHPAARRRAAHRPRCAFYGERVDLVVDGVRSGRPRHRVVSRYLTRR